MSQFFIDDFFEVKQYSLGEDEELFERILKEREGGIDPKRFYLEYIPTELYSELDFENPSSSLCSINEALITMGGCNLEQRDLDRGMRYSGIKISDPSGLILGTFDVHEDKMTYSPIFPHFWEERDVCKFAYESYITRMTYEEIIAKLIERTHEFYLHVGGYTSFADIANHGIYRFEKITKEEMIKFSTQPKEGQMVLKRSLHID